MHDVQVEVVAVAHVLDVPERLGEVVLRVEEHHFDLRRDLHREVDQDAVLERRREHGFLAERLPRPGDRRGGRLVLQARGDLRELGQVGQLQRRGDRREGDIVGGVLLGGHRLRAHVAHSLSPTCAS